MKCACRIMSVTFSLYTSVEYYFLIIKCSNFRLVNSACVVYLSMGLLFQVFMENGPNPIVVVIPSSRREAENVTERPLWHPATSNFGGLQLQIWVPCD